MLLYLLRTFIFRFSRPEPIWQRGGAAQESTRKVELAPREERRLNAELEALAE
ncbi:MAG: hypothetical protein N2515_02480 [Deltaproteobacteria bacterium]|nr:hypothetical protein [Deltaproteobacteria bacterium]